MGLIIETKITKWDGGMVNDPRSKKAGACRIIKHLDNYTDETRLTPYTDIDFTAVVEPTSAVNFDSYRIQQIVYTNGAFYGLGVQDGTTKPKIFTKTLINDEWVAGTTTGDFASLVAATTAQKMPFIVYVEGSSWNLYGLDGGGWWKYGDITGTPTWTRVVYTATFLNTCPPVVHSKDNVMYCSGGQGTTVSNRIIKNNAGSWSDPLLFGLYTKIPSICEYGNYLAIATNEPDGNTNVYLWDRDSSLATLSEKINWGSGTIKFIANIGGILVGCSVMQPTTALSINPQIVFKYWTGSEIKIFAEFTASAMVIDEFITKQSFNNLFYFLAEMTLNSIALRGVWKIVKHNDGRLTVSFDRLPRLDDTVVSGTLYGFLRTGDFFHVATKNINDSDKYIVSKTDTTYSTTASFETPIIATKGSDVTKKIVGITVTHEPLPTAGAVIVKYKADAETSWTQILNNGTDDSIRHSSINIESSGVNLKTYKEVQFQILPSGGAVVTGLKFREEIIEDDLY